jgi:hypothetical protein
MGGGGSIQRRQQKSVAFFAQSCTLLHITSYRDTDFFYKYVYWRSLFTRRNVIPSRKAYTGVVVCTVCNADCMAKKAVQSSIQGRGQICCSSRKFSQDFLKQNNFANLSILRNSSFASACFLFSLYYLHIRQF